jgi:hypothetical protein
MESDSEKESRLIREFWESLTPQYLDRLLEEIARKSDALLNFGEPSMPHKTRRKKPRK